MITSKATEDALRKALRSQRFTLSRRRTNGETGVDILATSDGSTIHIEVIGHKSSPPARSKDFFESFFRAVSRLRDGATRCAIALPDRARLGLPRRAKQYGPAWVRIGEAFPELEIWLVDVPNAQYQVTKWNLWAGSASGGAPSRENSLNVSEVKPPVDIGLPKFPLRKSKAFAPRSRGRKMKTLCILQSRSGRVTRLGYDFSSGLDELVHRGDTDCCIQSSEMGFSPLGASREFLSDSLGVGERTLNKLAGCINGNQHVSIMGVPARNPNSPLRGLILAAGQSANSYQQFGASMYGKPYKDFFYNVAYESIAYAANALGARKLCMSHLSFSGRFNGIMATCIAEALAHYCDDDANPLIESFMFFGCCITVDHLKAIEQLNREGEQTQHRPIHTWKADVDGYEVLNLDWR